MEKYPQPVTQNYTRIILEQMNNSIYKINTKENDFRTGFFCHIKYKNKNIPALITNYDIINDIKKNVIHVSLNEINNQIELGKTRYINELLDIAILEIKDNKNNKINFLEIDDRLYHNNTKNYYSNKSLYILLYNKVKELSVSYGLINRIKDSEIIYTSYKYINNKISRIFNSTNNKLIGIHKNISYNYNRGINFKYLIDQFIKQYKEISEINLIINIKKDEINRKIYFLDNYYYNENNEFNNNHDNLKELNEFNTELYINNKKYVYQKFFIPETEGDYNIKLIFYIYLTDCSFMFSGCYNIKNINLFSFITTNVINMSNMFSGCNGLEYLDLSSFNTKNVINMNKMFYNCHSLEYLDISSFNIKNVKYMNYILYDCLNLINLKSCPSLYNNISKNKNNIFFGNNKLKEFNIKFIGEVDYLKKRIKNIKYIESIDSIKVHEDKLILSKGKNEVIFNLMAKKEYLNSTYHKPDCIIFVINMKYPKDYEFMKVCCKYYIKNYNLIYLFTINLSKHIENEVKQFANLNNLKLIRINEDNKNYIKNFLNNLLIELEKNENKNIINQGNIKIMKEIPSKEYEIFY